MLTIEGKKQVKLDKRKLKENTSRMLSVLNKTNSKKRLILVA